MLTLDSFPNAATAVVIGSSQGIGLAMVDALLTSGRFETVVACSRQPARAEELKTLAERFEGMLELRELDLTRAESIEALASSLKTANRAPSLVLNVAGLLHQGQRLQPEKRLEDIELASLEQVFAVNAFGPAQVMKHLLPMMRRDGKGVMAVLSARVGSIGDNRLGGWYAYRASKAALNQFMKTASVEARRRFRNVILTALHPGTTDTGLSAPFQANVPEGKLFKPGFVAEHLLTVIDQLGEDDSGRFFAWDGEAIDW